MACDHSAINCSFNFHFFRFPSFSSGIPSPHLYLSSAYVIPVSGSECVLKCYHRRWRVCWTVNRNGPLYQASCLHWLLPAARPAVPASLCCPTGQRWLRVSDWSFGRKIMFGLSHRVTGKTAGRVVVSLKSPILEFTKCENAQWLPQSSWETRGQILFSHTQLDVKFNDR